MVDVEVAGDVTRHPDVVNPEEVDLGGCLCYGPRCTRVGDVDSARAVCGIRLGVPWDLIIRHKPLAPGISLAGDDWSVVRCDSNILPGWADLARQDTGGTYWSHTPPTPRTG